MEEEAHDGPKYEVVEEPMFNAPYLAEKRKHRAKLNGKFVDEFLSNFDEVMNLFTSLIF